MNKPTFRVALVFVSATVFASSTNCGALAQDDLGLGVNQSRPAATRTHTTRQARPTRTTRPGAHHPAAHASAGSGATMSEVRQDVVRELERLATPQTPDAQHKIDVINKEGEDLFQKGMYQDALLRWQKAYGESIESKYSEGQGTALTGMCRVYVSQGKYVKARHLGENAVEVLAAINSRTLLGKARIALAQAYTGLENHVWAAKQLDAALELIVSNADKEPLEAAGILRMSGGLLLQYKKVKEAIQFFQASAKYSEQGGDLDSALWMHTHVASILTELGYYVAALEEAQKAVVISERIKDPRAKITALSSRGNIEYVLGEFYNARLTYDEAFQIAKKLPPKGDMSKEGKAYLLMGYAFALVATGDDELASRYLNQVIPYFEKEGKYYHQAESVNALGILKANAGEAYKALPLFAQARDLQTFIKPPQPGMHVMILRNMAACEYRLGKPREAFQHLKTILPFFEKHKDRLQMQQAQVYVSLAEVSMKMGDTAAAETYLNEATTLGETLKDDSSLWRAYTLRAHLALVKKENDKAKEYLKTALSHFRSPQAGYFPNAELLRFPSSRRDFGLQLAALVASQGMTEHALLIAEQLKEERFISTFMRKGATVKAADKDVYNDLMRQRAHLHAAENASTPDKFTKEWTEWLVRFSTLARENSSLARLIAPYPTTVKEILEKVKQKDVTVVDYLVGEKSSMAFTVDPQGRISASVIPAGEDKLKKAVADLLTTQQNGEEHKVLKSLYLELLPQPVRNFLPISSDKQIVIIPDGVLYNLPFSALCDADGKYLVEKHLLTLAPSMRYLLDATSGSRGAVNMLLASNGNPMEQEEASQISSVLLPDPVSTLTTRQADLETLSNEVQGKSVLHLATALPLTEDNPFSSAIPFRRDGSQQGATASQLFGIAMPRDLVVLSGSSVSGPKLDGDAVQAFSRGLTYAGTQNLMMSLWKAPDDARIAELVSFYKHKKEGMNAAQSLRKAQLLSLSSDRNPRSWASFQLLGLGM
ncbi:MAG: CHAT domain-containing protein [Cyanobacteria bacterium HKST-UBA02]|nr:CHAT domain-containing protein [Cyanobacteria bacterium HKST-UBA02]